MFKFDFEIEEEDDQVQLPVFTPKQTDPAGPSSVAESSQDVDKACYHTSLEDLIKTLPEAISYSPLYHKTLYTPLLRRDLFDARFQLINRETSSPDTLNQKEGKSEEGEGEEYVDAQTDLIPGLYEGGLKTWEGGVDLIEVLVTSLAQGKEDDDQSRAIGQWVKGGKVLEVGCGTSLPSAFILRSLLSLPPSSSPRKTTLHLQDYNSLVLSLVTLPNLILASLPYLPPDVFRLAEDGDEPVETVVPDLDEPGNLSLNKDLVAAFKKLLEERGVELKFTYGHWEGLSKELKEKKAEEKYGLVLTAETIYAEDSTPALIEVLREAVGKPSVKHHEVQLENSLGDLTVRDDWAQKLLSEAETGSVLVAAKVLYFGVGGGLGAFLDAAKANGAHHSPVKEWTQGVGRQVVQVGW